MLALHFTVMVRLLGGSNPFEGRVELFLQGQWGTVCNDGWSTEEANVICRQLGYPSATRAWQGARLRPETGPTLNVSCNGTELSIDECDHSGWDSDGCSQGQGVGVTCGEDQVDETSSQSTSLFSSWSIATSKSNELKSKFLSFTW